MRLDKFLCDCGIGTRSEVKKYIKRGEVSVNGVTAKAPELSVTPESRVLFREKPLTLKGESYYLFHKPGGCVTAREDSHDRTVLDYFPEEARRGLSPIGRLDKDTEGLLILTTDGALLHQLISPRRHVEKTYYARLDAPVPPNAAEVFARGIDIGDDRPTAPAGLVILTEDGTEAELTLTEGRFHQVKRMFHALGCEVTYLKRIREGGLTLGELKPGQYRALTAEEIAGLKSKSAEN